MKFFLLPLISYLDTGTMIRDIVYRWNGMAIGVRINVFSFSFRFINETKTMATKLLDRTCLIYKSQPNEMEMDKYQNRMNLCKTWMDQLDPRARFAAVVTEWKSHLCHLLSEEIWNMLLTFSCKLKMGPTLSFFGAGKWKCLKEKCEKMYLMQHCGSFSFRSHFFFLVNV